LLLIGLMTTHVFAQDGWWMKEPIRSHIAESDNKAGNSGFLVGSRRWKA
jgi:hypothetical protein